MKFGFCLSIAFSFLIAEPNAMLNHKPTSLDIRNFPKHCEKVVFLLVAIFFVRCKLFNMRFSIVI